MKISIISQPYNIFNNQKSVSCQQNLFVKGVNNTGNKPVFCASYTEDEIRARQTLSKQRNERVRGISEEEYNDIIDDLIENHSSIDCRYKSSTDHFIDLSYCEDIPFEFMGVIPYCGYESSSKRINKYLLGIERKADEETEQKKADYISALNYSLEKIDEKYGKFEGYTYRRGHFSPNTNRYYATGQSVVADSYIYNVIDNGLYPDKIHHYNVIKLKNGHKVNKMLNEYSHSHLKELASQEDEIIIDAKSKFRYVNPSEYSDKEQNICDEYFNKIKTYQKSNYSDEELNKKIRIHLWEEI